MKGIFGDLFDLDGNGRLDPVEREMEFAVIDDMMKEDEDPDEEEYSLEELDDFDLFEDD